MDNAPESAESGNRVLLVEDDDDVRDVTNFILSQMGFEVLEVGKGNEALQILESSIQIDLLLSDIGLPGGMNGVELALKARQTRPSLPVLLVSAYDEESLEQFGATEVNATILRKPYLQEDLELEIGKALQK